MQESMRAAILWVFNIFIWLLLILGILLFVWPIVGLPLDAAFKWHLGGRLFALTAGLSMLIGLALIGGVLGSTVLESIKIWWDSHKRKGGPETQN